MSRPPELHPSALSEAEHAHYTRALAALSSPSVRISSADWQSVKDVNAMSVRRYLAGTYAVEDEVVEQILAIFHPTPTLDDTLTPSQFFAVLRLVSHAQRGREVDRNLIFAQTPPPIIAKSTRPPPKHGSVKPSSPVLPTSQPSPPTPNTAAGVSRSHSHSHPTPRPAPPTAPVPASAQPLAKSLPSTSPLPRPPSPQKQKEKHQQPRAQSPEKPILPPPQRKPSWGRKSMGDAPRPVLPVAAGAVPEVPPVPRRSLGDSPNPFRKPSQHSVSASVSPPVPAVPSVSASTPGPAPGAADTSSPAHNPFRPGSSAATPTPAPPLPRRPSITASPSPARPPLPPRQPSMPSSPAHRLHVRAASVAGTERTITPRKMASAPPAPVAVPATASASPAPVPAKPAPPKPPKPAGFITSSATPLSPLIRESLAAARERRAVEAADPGRKKHVEVIRSSNPLAMFAQAQANAQAQSSASSGSSGAHPGNAPHHAHARRRTVLTGDGEGMEREQVDTTTDDGSRASDADGVDAAEESMDEDEIRAALGKARSRSFGTLKDLPAAEEKDQRRRDVLPPPPRRRPDSMQVLPPGSKARRAGNTGGLSRHSSLSLPPPPPYQPPTLPSLSHLLSQTKQSLDLGVEKLSLAAQQAHATHARHPSGEKLASSVGNAVSLELQRLKRGSVSRGYVGVEGEGWGRRGVGEQPLMGEVEEGEDRESPFGPVGPGLGRGLTPYGGDGDEGEVFADQRTKGDEGWVRLS